MIFPASRHITRSEKRITACMMCSIMMMVMSSSPRLIRRSSTSSTSEEESPAMASSEIKSFGRTASARASSILRNSTWLSVSVDAPALEARPIRVRIDIATSSSGRLDPTVAKSSPTIRFSSTVMLLNGRGIWKLRAMPRRARKCGGNCVMSSPQNTTLPTCGRSAPEMQLISVVLPEPFGPIRPNRSPFLMSTLILSSAVKPPKVLVSVPTCSKGASSAGVGVMAFPPRADDSAAARDR